MKAFFNFVLRADPYVAGGEAGSCSFANGKPSPDELSSNCGLPLNVQVWASSRQHSQFRLIGPETPISGFARELLGGFDVTRYHILSLWLRREKGSDGL